MDESLLKEFWIAEYGDSLIIDATDTAYNQLTKNSEKIDEYYYIIALVNYLKNNYTINGLLRESRGNSHDALYQKEIIVFNDGGDWKDELNKYKSEKASTYEDKPIVLNKENINKEIIEEWAKRYNLSYCGEGRRVIFCSCERMYAIEHTVLFGRSDENIFNYKKEKTGEERFEKPSIYLRKSPIFLRRIEEVGEAREY